MRAFVYLRVSTSQQEDHGAGLDLQRDACLAYCREQGYIVIQEFADTHTGSQFRERREMTAMRERMRAGEVDVVVSYAVDRLSRNQAHLAILLDEAEYSNVRLECATEKFENDAVGKLVLSVRAFAAEIEREKIRMRTMGGKRKRIDEGRMLAGRNAPYGYRWVEENGKKIGFEVLEFEASVIRRAFEEVFQGASVNSVAARLRESGIKTKSGSMWEGSALTRILQNPVYKGEPAALRYEGYSQRVKSAKRGQKVEWGLSKGVTLQGFAPAIVSRQVWDEVQERIANNKRFAIRNAKDPEESLLRGGFAICGYCGGTLTHVTAREITRQLKSRVATYVEARHYKCNVSSRTRYGCPCFTINGDKLDRAVWDLVKDRLANPGFILAKLQGRHQQDPTEDDRDSHIRQLAEIDKKIRKLQNALMTAEDDFQALLVKQGNDLSKLRKSLINELAEIDQQHDQWKASQEEIVTLEKWIEDMRAVLDEDLTWSERRVVLRNLGIRVRVFAAKDSPRVLVDWEVSPDGILAESFALEVGRGAASAPDFSCAVTHTSRSTIHCIGNDTLRFTFALAI